MYSHYFTTAYLLLLISLGYVATDIYLPSLPAIASYFSASDHEMQMTLSSYLLSFSLTPLILGPLSDQIGRKKVILGGVMVGLLATLASLFAANIVWLIASRFVQGIGMGATVTAARVTVSDLFTGAALSKQMSVMTMITPLVLAGAPTLGGLLQEMFQWQAIGIFLLSYMAFILTWVTLRSESLHNRSDKKIAQIFTAYRALLSNRVFLMFGVNSVLPSLGVFAYLTISPFLFQERIGLSPFEYGSLSLYIGGAIIATGFIHLKLIRRFSQEQLLVLGGGLIAFAGLLLLFFHLMGILTTWSLLAPSLIFYTCLPFCKNAVSKAMSAVHGNLGAATAILTTLQLLTGSLGSLIFSFVAGDTALPLALCFLAVGIFSLINLKFACWIEKGCN